MIILVGGGSRSGKSAKALEIARRYGPQRGFLATAQAFDDEMTERIRLHQAERGDEFTTVEEPILLGAICQVSEAASLGVLAWSI